MEFLVATAAHGIGVYETGRTYKDGYVIDFCFGCLVGDKLDPSFSKMYAIDSLTFT